MQPAEIGRQPFDRRAGGDGPAPTLPEQPDDPGTGNPGQSQEGREKDQAPHRESVLHASSVRPRAATTQRADGYDDASNRWLPAGVVVLPARPRGEPFVASCQGDVVVTRPEAAGPPETVPVMPWSATGSRWRARPLTLVVLVIGLWLFGTGEAVLVDARLGNSPWTVLAQGISRHSPLTIGGATLLVSVLVLLAWVPLRERPGLGTLANAVIVAVAIDVMLPLLPTPAGLRPRLLEVFAAIVCIGLASGLYLTANLGPGPRDGWMTGVCRRTGWPVNWVRFGIEASALGSGAVLGGRVGVGTLLFAVLVGHAVGGVLGGLRRAR